MKSSQPLSRMLTIAILLTLVFSLFSPLSAKPALAVSAPELLDPADYATITPTGYGGSLAAPPVAIPEFSWSSIEGTTSYRVQFSQDIAFTTKFEYTTPHTRINPHEVSRFSDGLWFWRVRVDAPVVSDYSAPFRFTRTWASADNQPVLLNPAEGENLEFFNSPTFSWEPVIGAAEYTVQIATSPEFTTIAYKETTLATSIQPATKLDNGTYYWRVIPLDPSAREGQYSEIRSFVQGYNQVPQQLEPTDDSTPTFTPTFRWTAGYGAQFYRLQYSTDPTFNTDVTTIDTKNTTYSPTSPLPNDVDYYWRVRTHSNKSISEWSQIWSFRKQWYIQPQLLTPPNNFQWVRLPFFSWAPVPGASYYITEYDTEPDFTNPDKVTTANPFSTPNTFGDKARFFETSELLWYWRVTPYDKNNNAGKTSAVWSFRGGFDFNTPQQVYPFYYYPPNDFPPPDENVAMQPHEDRTAALPIFVWNRLTNPYPIGGTFASAYRLQVDTDTSFNPPVWTVDTENTSAAPDSANPFVPSAGIDYYWRVRSLDGIGGDEIGNWSQTWRARFDLSLGLEPASDVSPQLLRPARSAEIVETTPLYEWWPLEGAGSYEIQVSKDSAFAELVDSATIPYAAYASTTSLAQRFLERYDYGTYYWRVRATGGTPPPGGWQWSEAWRFQIASQSEWVRARGLGQENNRLLIADDPASDVGDPNYDLTGLYASQDIDYWYFGFDTTDTSADMTYGLYLDVDHKDGSGATFDPLGYDVTTIPAHQPEYAIYVNQSGREFEPEDVSLHRWTGSSWAAAQSLFEVGGDLAPTDLYGLALPSSTNGWAVGQYGDILKWNGAQWDDRFSPTVSTLRDVDMLSTTDGWAVGDDGVTARWDGFSWTFFSSPTTYAFRSVSLVHTKLGFAAGDYGKIYKWSGTSWGPQTSNTIYDLYGIDVITSTMQTNRTEGWAVGNTGTILHWNGTSWSVQPSPTTDDLKAVVLLNDSDGWAVGEGGTILHWDGLAWSEVSSPTGATLNGLFLLSTTTGWAVGDDGVILSWDGSNWSSDTSPTDLALYAVAATAGDYALAVGENGANLYWDGNTWSFVSRPVTGFVELKLPNTAIGMDENTGSYAVSLFSLATGGVGGPQDSSPSDPNAPGSGELSRFASVSERMNLVFPPNNLEGDPTIFPSILPFFWDYPTGSAPYTPWAGALARVYLDPQYTNDIADSTISSDAEYYSYTSTSWPDDLEGDNTYYWRVRPRYEASGAGFYGAWSQGWVFERRGFSPTNLQESVTFATPTFSWDITEGAESYDLQVDSDPSFGSPDVSITTTQNDYTPITTLANGTYYWRVRAQRDGDIKNEWSTVKVFTLALPVPTGLNPDDPGGEQVVGRAPTFCWDPIEAESGGIPVLAAYKYRVQVSKGDPTFSVIYDTLDTEQTCWTPIKGYDDGEYYWRVAMLDGQLRLGDYSLVAEYTKQYPAATPFEPANGSWMSETPTFRWCWSAVEGECTLPYVFGAASYKVEISQYSTFSPIYDSVTTNSTSYTPTKAFAVGFTYYWRVAIVDDDSKVGPFSDAIIILNPWESNYRTYLPLLLK